MYMANIESISELELQDTEYCYLVGNQKYSNSSFKVKVPRIMPNVTKKGRDSFNKNILINATECKPSVSSSVYMYDYITVRRSAQCDLFGAATIYEHPTDDYPTIIRSGTKLRCLCTNGNYKELTIVDYV